MSNIIDREGNEIKTPEFGATYIPDDDAINSHVVCKKIYIQSNEEDFVEVWFGESSDTLYRFNGKTKWTKE